MSLPILDWRQLSVAERLLLVEEMWDSIAASSDQMLLPAWHTDELNRRKVEHLKRPEGIVSWDEAKRRILEGRNVSEATDLSREAARQHSPGQAQRRPGTRDPRID